MVWHIGNTTVRTPYRLREALIALQGTSLNGNLHGRDQETAFAVLLHESGVVDVQRIENGSGSDVSDLGRKWRSALSQLGFIVHKVDEEVLKHAVSAIPSLSGRPFEITPNGYRLIKSDPITAQQETFLRSLLAYQIPSPIEPRYNKPSFNPLKFTIDIIFQLEIEHEEPFLAFDEFALFVQMSTPANGIETTAKNIIEYRKRKRGAAGNLRNFYRQEYESTVKNNNPGIAEDKIATKAQTLDDYADLTLRYLKATGLFRNKGHGISLTPLKVEVANLIHNSAELQFGDVDYLINLWNGAKLPTDEEVAARKVLENLSKQIEEKGEAVTPVKAGEDVSIKRHELEERLLHLEEIEYYKRQGNETKEISAWIRALIDGRASLPSGEPIRVPKGEAPAYFEWIIWRAFLAINSLKNEPWEARRFQIDQDFLPVNTAPGNGPDMIFEFDDSIIVVEVTLTNSSRQEAAEGEPVRRHVAKYSEAQIAGGKTVYGLFIALNIDSNTAHTFRTGDWYLNDDTKINLHIVPMTLTDFYKLFIYGEDKLDKMPSILKTVLLTCRAQANQDAPTWKKTITSIIEGQIKN